MKYAEVAVNSPIARRNSFCYSIPPRLNVDIGHAVWVPFGSKLLQGIVVELSDFPSVEVTKEIGDLISPSPLLSQIQIEFAYWLCEHYLASLFDTIALMLPPAFEQRLVTYLHLSQQTTDLSQLNSEQVQLVNFFKNGGWIKFRDLEKRFGKKRAERIIRQLVHRNVLLKSERLQEVRIKPKLVPHLRLNINRDEVEAIVDQLRKARANKQVAVIELLANKSRMVSLVELRKSIDCQLAVIKSLQGRGLISIEDVIVRRDPLAQVHISSTLPPVLTAAQKAALEAIQKELVRECNGRPPSIFLLKGVTGSGKTEVYLRTSQETVSQGKRGICLVPEIALTAQTIQRFASRFPGRVAVFHSGLSLGEQYDEWLRIKRGECDVVIGPRSALFAPQPDLGLIIIDEEHEWTYKQADKSPRYHARDAAIKLAELSNSVVILGSATPDVETFYHTQDGRYRLIQLKERITPRGVSPLPDVEVIDLCDELKAGNRSLFSRSLARAISEVLDRREQAILFLNRRGTSTFVQCRNCGFVPSCRHCTAALTYHSLAKKLICHHCRYFCTVPAVCPQCGSQRLKLLGIGTQKVEEETKRFFPQARIIRWDSDIATKRRAHEELLATFQERKADILIGTQMIAKGLDLPYVTLVGVVSADTGINFPDFRAGERTFQLSCQVAGRAGRGLAKGRVIIQTYSPQNYAISAASRQDYGDFYYQEIEYRRQFGYPPFSCLARLVYTHTSPISCRQEAERLSRLIVNERDRRGIADLRLIGPAPAFMPRVRGRYHWQIILCGQAPAKLLREMTFPQGWIIDIDPVTVL
jgi:primosomal protein N' (replication factor Y)